MNKYFGSLDVLRTILALTIALGHFFIWNGKLGIIPQSFYMAVDIFFVLSGFVLTQKTIHSKIEETSRFANQFAFKRFFRIYPLYILLFVVCTLMQLIEFGKDVDSFHYFLKSFFLLQAMGFETNANHIFADTVIRISWSISVELWMGLLFFPLVFILKKHTKILLIFCLILAGGATSLIIFFSPNYLNVNLQRIGFLTFGGIRCAGGLALGCISFFIFEYLNRTNFRKDFYVILELLVFAACLSCFFLEMHYHFIAPYLFAILIAVLALNRGWFSRLLSLEIFSSLRPLSYGIYLIHPFYANSG